MATDAAARRIEPGVAGRTAFTLRVQTGLRRAVQLLHHPDDARRAEQRADRGCRRARSTRDRAAGFKEIALTGVHLGSYGRDLDRRQVCRTLLELLARDSTASGADDVPLFRISSLEPMDCTPDIVDLVARLGRDSRRTSICRCSTRATGCCAAMRRPYTLDYYAALVDAIRARMPHASIGSDVIVGFPGETDERLRGTRSVSGALAADASARLSVLGSAGHCGVGTWRAELPESSSGSAVHACADRRDPRADVPRFASRDRASGADARRRLAGGDG